MIKKGGFFLLILLAVGAYFAYPYAKLFYLASRPNTSFEQQKKAFYIKSIDSLDVVYQNIGKELVKNYENFEFVAQEMNYSSSKLVPGKYVIEKGMTNKEIVTQLRGGYGRKEVTITFNNIRFKDELCEKLSTQIEAEADDICALLNDPNFVAKYGFNTTTIMTLFLPNSYRLQWSTTAEALIDRMAQEYKAFWTDERKQKARNLGLSQSEVSTLASIVQAEQSVKKDEQPVIAGLYINRLRARMPLQSDPTLIFALGDYSIRRVLNEHKKISSPYNTYIYPGLPPGPINLPEISAIDAVLNYDRNNYYYMCAKPDFSGYHNFARNYSQHLIYAREYQRALNRRRIMK